MASTTEDAARQRRAPGRRFYKTDRWRRLRKAYLRARPRCAVCGRPARHVDHVRAHRGDEALFFAPGNLQSLCHSCHSSKTARSDGGFGNRTQASTRPSGACGPDGGPLDPKHPWNK